LSDNKNKQRRY